jgi:HlyD family secretion protein
MKKEKWQEKVGKIFRGSLGKIKNFYQTKRKLAIGLSAAIVILVVFLGVYIGSTSKKSATISYTSLKVTKGNITQTVDAVGNVEAVPSVILNWKTSGIIGSVNVKNADQVKEGDVLATLINNSLDSSILTAQNDLLAAKLTLDTLKAGNMQFQTATQTLATAQKAYEKALAKRDWWVVTGVSDAAIDVARVKYYDTKAAFWNAQQAYEALALASKNAAIQSTPTTPTAAPASGTDPQAAATSTTNLSSTEKDAQSTQTGDALTNAYNAMKTAELAYFKASRNLNYMIGNGYGNNNVVEQEFLAFDVAKATLAEAEATWQTYKDSSPYIKAAEAKVQALQNTVDSAKIIAPFNGTVTDSLVNQGKTVSSGAEAFQVDNLNSLEISVSVSEVDVNKLAVGQEAEITFSAISGKTYKGVVEQVGSAGSTSSGVVEFYATIKVLDADQKVKPGFSANISIIVNQVQNVLLVPNQAVMTDSTSGKSYVIVSANGKMTKVIVEVGLKSDTYTEVTSSNLKEGDTVLVVTSSSSSDSSNNRALFGIMGGFGGGEPPRNFQQSNSSGSSSSGRTG